MELNFDKEMDALLRQTARQENSAVPPAEAHLDADTFAAFSANALPAKARERAMGHLVDCGTCRTVLSNLVFFEDRGEEKASFASAASVPAVKEASLVDRILGVFKFPALAYGMAALVLLFTGAIGLMILRSNSDGPQVASLSKNEAAKPAEMPMTFANDTGSASNYTVQTNTNSSATSAVAAAANTAVSGAFAVSPPVATGYAAPEGPDAAAASKPADTEKRLDESELKIKTLPAGGTVVLDMSPAPASGSTLRKEEVQQPKTQTVDQVNNQVNTQKQDNFRYNNNIMVPDGAGNDRGRRSGTPAQDSRALSNDAQRDEKRLKDEDDTVKTDTSTDKNEPAKKAAGKKNKKKPATNAAAEAPASAPKPTPTPTPTPAKKPDEEDKDPC